jgi:Amino acid kinase family
LPLTAALFCERISVSRVSKGAVVLRVGGSILTRARAHGRVAAYLKRRIEAEPEEKLVTLGRGGSDLSAVLLGAGLGASRCELLKHVPGYFEEDPRANARAAPLPSLSFEKALGMAEFGRRRDAERDLARNEANVTRAGPRTGHGGYVNRR